MGSGNNIKNLQKLLNLPNWDVSRALEPASCDEQDELMLNYGYEIPNHYYANYRGPLTIEPIEHICHMNACSGKFNRQWNTMNNDHRTNPQHYQYTAVYNYEGSEYSNNDISDEDDGIIINSSSTEKESENFYTNVSTCIPIKQTSVLMENHCTSDVSDLTTESDTPTIVIKQVDTRKRKKPSSPIVDELSDGSGEPTEIIRTRRRMPSRIPKFSNSRSSYISEISDKPPESPNLHIPERRVRILETTDFPDSPPSHAKNNGSRSIPTSGSSVSLKPILKNRRSHSRSILSKEKLTL